jgi:hypothetical protein
MSVTKEFPIDVSLWFHKQAATLWPAALGSLSLRRTRCIRENCQACLKGEQHASHVLSGRIKGRRFSLYIPDEIVPELERCLDNGRKLQDLLYQSAFRYARSLKHERTSRNQKVKK